MKADKEHHRRIAMHELTKNETFKNEDAIYKYGITRLPARICELNKVKGITIDNIKPFGQMAEYKLIKDIKT